MGLGSDFIYQCFSEVKMAKILSGTKISKEVLSDLQREVAEIKQSQPNFRPKLAIVQVGGREDSNVYIRAKCKVNICGTSAI